MRCVVLRCVVCVCACVYDMMVVVVVVVVVGSGSVVYLQHVKQERQARKRGAGCHAQLHESICVKSRTNMG
jgi:hypothetical protein